MTFLRSLRLHLPRGLVRHGYPWFPTDQVSTRLSEENQVQAYMHARIKFHAYSDIKVNTEIVSRKKKKDYQRFTLNPGNEGTKHHRQSTGGCVRLALHNIFTSSSCSFLLLSNIVYSKGEHLSYSASMGKDMNAKAL
jgi:hypothetical protein